MHKPPHRHYVVHSASLGESSRFVHVDHGEALRLAEAYRSIAWHGASDWVVVTYAVEDDVRAEAIADYRATHGAGSYRKQGR